MMRIFLFCLCVILGMGSVQAKVDFRNNTPDEVKLKKRALRLAKNSKWEEVSKWIKVCKAKRLCSDNGELQLMFIYPMLQPENHLEDADGDEKWLAWLERIKKWEATTEDKELAHVLKMNFWYRFSWEVDDRAERGKRLAKAMELYEEKAEGGVDDPWFYFTAMRMARYSGWEEERAKREVFLPGIEQEPRNSMLISAYGDWLRVSWFDPNVDEYRFYRSLIDLMPGSLGELVYTQILLTKKAHHIGTYSPEEVDWEAMKTGAELLFQEHPKAYESMEKFMMFASKHDELEEGVELLEGASEEAFENFSNESPFGRILQLSTLYESELERVNYIKPDPHQGVDHVYELAWMPDGESYVVNAGRKGVAVIGADLDERGHSYNSKDGRVLKEFAVSPDGKFIAISSSYDAQEKRSESLIYICELGEQGFREVKVFLVPPRKSIQLRFSADGRFLFSSHAVEKAYNYKGKVPIRGLDVCEWQAEGAEFRSLVHIKKAGFYIGDLRNFSGEGKWMYYAEKGIRRIDLSNLEAEPELIIDVEKDGLGKVSDYDFIQEGELIIALCYGKKTGAQLAVYDTQTRELVAKRSLKEFKGYTYLIEALPGKKGELTDFFMAGSHGGLIRMTYDSKSKEFQMRSIDFGNGLSVYSMAISPQREDGYRVTIGTNGGMIGNWKVQPLVAE
ncbi:MAG: hypothetical protein ACSHX2_00060 [Rubritalea sp.]